MADTAARILKRYDQLVGNQANCLKVWQDISDFVIPSKGNIQTKRFEGAKQTDRLFDSTAPHALVLLASSMHQSMTPSTQPWLSLKMRQAELNDVKEVNDWLEDCSRRMHAAFRQSQFNQSVHELYLDLAAFGTGALLVESKQDIVDKNTRSTSFGGFRFMVPAVGDYVIAEDADGVVDTLFRRFTMSHRAAAKKWGEAKLGPELASKAREKPDDMLEIIHAVYPREDIQYDDQNQRRKGNKNMPYASCYVAKVGKIKLEESGFEEFPYCVPRWAKTSGEVYGRGPSHTALPDISSLNAAKQFILNAAPLAMWPPTLERDDAVVGPVDVSPLGRNVVNGAGPVGEQLQFMDTRQRVDMSQLVLAELRQGIHAIYFTDQLVLHEKPDMTATEVIALQEQMQRLLGPTTGRLESEFLNPLVQRAFSLMARAGAFLPLPAALQDVVGADQADLDIEYEGPLARAQRTIELGAQDRVIQYIQAISTTLFQIGATQKAVEVWDNVKLDKTIKNRAAITGLPSDNISSDDEIKQVRDTRQAEADKQAKLNAASQALDAAGKAAPFIQATSQATNGQQNGQTKVAA